MGFGRLQYVNRHRLAIVWCFRCAQVLPNIGKSVEVEMWTNETFAEYTLQVNIGGGLALLQARSNLRCRQFCQP